MKIYLCQDDDKTEIRITREFEYLGVVIKRGFTTDLASVPYRIKSLTKITEYKYWKAVIIHDALYRLGYDRKKADKKLDKALKELGMGRYERWKVYRGLRMFGSQTECDYAKQYAYIK